LERGKKTGFGNTLGKVKRAARDVEKKGILGAGNRGKPKHDGKWRSSKHDQRRKKKKKVRRRKKGVFLEKVLSFVVLNRKVGPKIQRQSIKDKKGETNRGPGKGVPWPYSEWGTQLFQKKRGMSGGNRGGRFRERIEADLRNKQQDRLTYPRKEGAGRGHVGPSVISRKKGGGCHRGEVINAEGHKIAGSVTGESTGRGTPI